MELEFKYKNCWDVFDENRKKEADDLAKKYLDFLSECKTERETVEWILNHALKDGFEEDFSRGNFLKVIKDKSIILARKGVQPLSAGLRIIGSHIDTVRLDFKQHPIFESCDLVLAKTHYYGGIRKYQWLSIPLAIHGVVIKESGEKIKICIGEREDEPVFVIVDLLPHLASKQNEKKISEAFEGEKLSPIIGSIPDPEKKENRFKAQILRILYEKYNITEEDLFSAELQFVPAGRAKFAGLDESMVGGYGQDDRICAFCSFEALMDVKEPEHTLVVVFWDKEEIGSDGATGAKSLFFEYIVQDLIEAWEPGAKLSQVMSKSKAISADVHGAMDPYFEDLHDKHNASKLGYGPVICKFTGHRGKVGANDASAEYIAWIKRILNEENIPWQMAELGKVDAGGGGTVAKFLAEYGMDLVDMGPSILGMHSPFEISSKADLYATYLAYRKFLTT